MTRSNGSIAAVLTIVVAGALFSSGCVYPAPPIDWERWRATFPDHAARPPLEKIAAIEQHLVERHLSPEGVLVYRRPDTPFDPDATGGYENLADEPIWGGCLAAAWSFKLAETGASEDRERLLHCLAGLRLLHDVTGKAGLFSRAVARAGVSFARGTKPHQEWRPGASGFEGLIYRGDVSKDQYFGVLFGYAAAAVALDLRPGGQEEELRRAIAPVATAVADHLWENDQRIVDIDGKTARFGDVRGFVLCVPIGPNAGLALGWQLLAWRLGGETRHRERYLALVSRGYAEAPSWNKLQFFGRTNHNNDVMAMMGLFTLTALEPDETILRTYRASLKHHWGLVRNEANLLYNGVYAAGAGEALPDTARRDVEETLRLFPEEGKLVLEAVDLRDHSLVERAFFNGRHGRPRNRTALPLHLRALSSFAWKSSPFALTANESYAEKGKTVSGVGFILGYWMARWAGLAED